MLLVGWDAADWQIIRPLLDAGALPNLQRLIEGGTLGNLSTLRPMLSPMLWNSIATGQRADKHGILGFAQVEPSSGKVRPYPSHARKVKAIWNILSQHGWRCHVVNWLASHPAEYVSGVAVSEAFVRHLHAGEKGAPPPAHGVSEPALAESLAALAVRPEDVEAASIALFVPRFAEIDQDGDRSLEHLAILLAECFTTHALATHLMAAEPWDFMAVYYAGLDHFSHGFMRFRAPKLAHVGAREFEFYRDVVDGAYRLHDLLLGRLLELAGEEATVVLCSDHGYQSGASRLRPPAATPHGPILEHRPFGVLAIKGPGIRRDELVHGAGLLDVAPTILHVAGLPLARDFDGRALLEIFETPVEAQFIDSWESVLGPEWRPPEESDDAPAALIEHFIALGYLPAKTGSDESYARVIQAENDWTLACVHMFAGRFREALPLLEEVYDQFPLRFDFGLMLGECLLHLRLVGEGREIIENIAATVPSSATAQILRATAAVALGDLRGALALLLQVEAPAPDLPLRIGMIYLRLNRVDDAWQCFDRALEVDPDNPLAFAGKARCFLKMERYQQACEAALDALAREFSLGGVHLILGICLLHLREVDRAIGALENAVRFGASRPIALRMLLRIYQTQTGREAEIARLRSLLKSHQEAAALRGAAAAQIRAEMKARADARDRKHAAESPLRTIPSSASAQEFLIVSGLPRAGTSAMMQMLARGGFPLKQDDARPADIDNPEGYCEWEPAKHLRKNPYAILECAGQAVKIVSALLGTLPREFRYRVIFMNRPLEEIVASQLSMRRRLEQGGLPDRGELLASLEKHRRLLLDALQAAPKVSLLIVDYPELVSNPRAIAKTVAEFVGIEKLPQHREMHAVIRPELHRNRSATASAA